MSSSWREVRAKRPPTGVPAPTFLDVVRELGQLSRDRCDPECSLSLHRQEAAQLALLLVGHPHLLRTLMRAVEQRRVDELREHYDNTSTADEMNGGVWE